MLHEPTYLMEKAKDAVAANDMGEARLWFERVLEIDGDNIEAMLWLAGLTTDPQQSLQYLEWVLELEPENPYALEGLGWARSQLGEDQGTPQQVDTPDDISEPEPEKAGVLEDPAEETWRPAEPADDLERLRRAALRDYYPELASQSTPVDEQYAAQPARRMPLIFWILLLSLLLGALALAAMLLFLLRG